MGFWMDDAWLCCRHAEMLKIIRESDILAVAPYSVNNFVQQQGMATAQQQTPFHQRQYYEANQFYCIPPNASFCPTTNSEPLISELNRQMGQFSGLPAQQNKSFLYCIL